MPAGVRRAALGIQATEPDGDDVQPPLVDVLSDTRVGGGHGILANRAINMLFVAATVNQGTVRSR